ncbi:MAG: cell wall hydrolase [Shimia sp.]
MFKLLTGAVIALVLPAAAMAEGALGKLGQMVQFETKAVAHVTDARAKTLLQGNAVPAGYRPSGGAAIEYSRDWLAAQPVREGGAQWRCLAEALYFEARGESVKGQFAVAEVIMNRVDAARFPDTVCAVVNQGTGRKYACQFTYTCDGLPERINEPRAWARVGKVAHFMLNGAPRRLTNGSTHYHTTAVNPRWGSVYDHQTTIGVHKFYRNT